MHQSRAVVKTVKTKFSKKIDQDTTGNSRHYSYEDDGEIDLSAIRSSKDLQEEEFNNA